MKIIYKIMQYNIIIIIVIWVNYATLGGGVPDDLYSTQIKSIIDVTRNKTTNLRLFKTCPPCPGVLK